METTGATCYFLVLTCLEINNVALCRLTKTRVGRLPVNKPICILVRASYPTTYRIRPLASYPYPLYMFGQRGYTLHHSSLFRYKPQPRRIPYNFSKINYCYYGEEKKNKNYMVPNRPDRIVGGLSVGRRNEI